MAHIDVDDEATAAAIMYQGLGAVPSNPKSKTVYCQTLLPAFEYNVLRLHRAHNILFTGCCWVGAVPNANLRWTPHPVIVTIVDNKDYIRVLLYSYYTPKP